MRQRDASRAKLEEHFEELGFPFDEIYDIQLSQSHSEMVEMLQPVLRSRVARSVPSMN